MNIINLYRNNIKIIITFDPNEKMFNYKNDKLREYINNNILLTYLDPYLQQIEYYINYCLFSNYPKMFHNSVLITKTCEINDLLLSKFLTVKIDDVYIINFPRCLKTNKYMGFGIYKTINGILYIRELYVENNKHEYTITNIKKNLICCLINIPENFDLEIGKIIKNKEYINHNVQQLILKIIDTFLKKYKPASVYTSTKNNEKYNISLVDHYNDIHSHIIDFINVERYGKLAQLYASDYISKRTNYKLILEGNSDIDLVDFNMNNIDKMIYTLYSNKLCKCIEVKSYFKSNHSKQIIYELIDNYCLNKLKDKKYAKNQQTFDLCLTEGLPMRKIMLCIVTYNNKEIDIKNKLLKCLIKRFHIDITMEALDILKLIDTKMYYEDKQCIENLLNILRIDYDLDNTTLITILRLILEPNENNTKNIKKQLNYENIEYYNSTLSVFIWCLRIIDNTLFIHVEQNVLEQYKNNTMTINKFIDNELNDKTIINIYQNNNHTNELDSKIDEYFNYMDICYNSINNNSTVIVSNQNRIIDTSEDDTNNEKWNNVIKMLNL